MKILIDTDIADDIDDAIALAFALGSPEFEILGVTVVYGDVETRAKVARKLLASWGRQDIPVRMGFERPLGFEYLPGAAPQECSQRPAVTDDPPLPDSSRTAPGFIAECVRRHPGEVHVVTLGAMTNVAAALCADPGLAESMPLVVSAAFGWHPCPGDGWRGDWNVRYDPIAAQCIARSGVAWTTTCGFGTDQALKQADFQALRASGLVSAELLLELIVLMNRHKFDNPDIRGIEDVPAASVGDVAALASLLLPERFGFTRGRLEIDADGRSRFLRDDAGGHRIPGTPLPAGTYRPEILERLLDRRR